MTNSIFYLYVNITFKVKTYLDEFPQNTRSRLGFRLILLKKMRFTLLKFHLSLLQLPLIGSVTPIWQTKGLRF